MAKQILFQNIYKSLICFTILVTGNKVNVEANFLRFDTKS